MGRTSVSRRLVYIKKTKNPVAPLPRKEPQPTSARAASTTPAPARVVRPVAVPSSGVKLFRSAAIFVGLVCAGAAVAMMGQARSRSADYAEQEITPAAPPPAPRSAMNPSDDYQTVGLPSVLSNRAAPTDESFRAAAYARRR